MLKYFIVTEILSVKLMLYCPLLGTGLWRKGLLHFSNMLKLVTLKELGTFTGEGTFIDKANELQKIIHLIHYFLLLTRLK
jgi:hypothetical protein